MNRPLTANIIKNVYGRKIIFTVTFNNFEKFKAEYKDRLSPGLIEHIYDILEAGIHTEIYIHEV